MKSPICFWPVLDCILSERSITTFTLILLQHPMIFIYECHEPSLLGPGCVCVWLSAPDLFSRRSQLDLQMVTGSLRAKQVKSPNAEPCTGLWGCLLTFLIHPNIQVNMEITRHTQTHKERSPPVSMFLLHLHGFISAVKKPEVAQDRIHSWRF